MSQSQTPWDAVIVGAGPAGLSAAIYLGRSQRRTIVLHSGRSMAKWEKDVQNYLGFPDGIAGDTLLARGLDQVRRFHIEVREETVQSLRVQGARFFLGGLEQQYEAKRVLLATGLTHLPPEIDGVRECLGHSLFFCKDCDAYRLKGKKVVIIGHNTEAAEYALGMLMFSPAVVICTNGADPTWPKPHDEWIRNEQIPVCIPAITAVAHDDGHLRSLTLASGQSIPLDAAFTTRGDVCHNALATSAGAKLDEEGQIVVDATMRTSVPGLYAAGCVTPANCQMIIAAGEGAIAGQAINRDLFEESLRHARLPRFQEESPVPHSSRG